MDRIYASGAAGSAPSVPASPSSGYPTAGNPGSGTPATKPGPYWYHMVMEELMAVILAGGITPAPGTLNQVLQALRSAGVFQTPAQFDSSTKAATTAFVQRALGNMQGVIAMTANLALTQAQVGAMVEATGAGGYTLTLCSTTGIGGGAFAIYNNCSSAITVSAAGGQNINVGTANVSSFSLPSGGTAWLVTDGVSWETIAGTVMGVGGNTTWQSLGGSRVAGTTYYNTTGRPIMVSVGMTTTVANTGIYATVSPGYTLWGSNSANSPYVAAICFIVPPGGSYSVQMQSGTTTILTWLELR